MKESKYAQYHATLVQLETDAAGLLVRLEPTLRHIWTVYNQTRELPSAWPEAKSATHTAVQHALTEGGWGQELTGWDVRKRPFAVIFQLSGHLHKYRICVTDRGATIDVLFPKIRRSVSL